MPDRNLGPGAHWKRKSRPDWEAVIEGIDKPGTVSAVFSSEGDAIACLKEIIGADFGLSVNISTSVEGARKAACACGIKRHSIEYSLKTNDPHDHLPESRIQEISTMCGHGMISFGITGKMLDMVREGRRTPEEAATTLMRFCPCGIFNPERAVRLIKEAVTRQS